MSDAPAQGQPSSEAVKKAREIANEVPHDCIGFSCPLENLIALALQSLMDEAGRLREEVEMLRSEAGYHDAKDVIEQLNSHLAAQSAEIARWKKALEGLTPQGSEFVNDPERCAAYVQDARTSERSLLKEKVKENARLKRALLASLPVKVQVLINEFFATMNNFDKPTEKDEEIKRLREVIRQLKLEDFYICTDCAGGGADGQDKCQKCGGRGVIYGPNLSDALAALTSGGKEEGQS